VAKDAPLILYIHGGGFTIGSPRTHAALAGHLAAHAGMRAHLPRYRLAPEHPFPAARDDIIARYVALCETAPPIAICGDSAGGCLALQLAQHIRDTGLPAPKALCLIGPIADLSRDPVQSHDEAPDEMLIPPQWAERIRDVFLPGLDPRDPAISPLLGDLTGLPPTLIQAGAEEALAHDARRLAEAHGGGHARPLARPAPCLAHPCRPRPRRRPRAGADGRPSSRGTRNETLRRALLRPRPDQRRPRPRPPRSPPISRRARGRPALVHRAPVGPPPAPDDHHDETARMGGRTRGHPALALRGLLPRGGRPVGDHRAGPARATRDTDLALADWIARLRALDKEDEETRKAAILDAWDSLAPPNASSSTSS
jgi:acetyl esterase/lipase